jgi:hypothetical protein
MSITSEVTKNLLDELEASKQRRLRAWNVLQRLRLVRSEHGTVAIPPPAQKTFDAEGEILEQALTKSLRIRSADGTAPPRRTLMEAVSGIENLRSSSVRPYFLSILITRKVST